MKKVVSVVTQTERATKAEIQRLTAVVCSRYSSAHDYECAIVKLRELGGITDEIDQQATHGRILRWKDQCNSVLSQKVREYRYAWSELSAQHETDVRFEDWLIGKTVGVLQDDILVVDLAGKTIPVMRRTQAELMEFQLLYGRFRVACTADGKEMVISSFH